MVRAFNFHTLAIMRKKVYDINECKYGGMVDAQVSDACDLIIVRVQISLFAPSKQKEKPCWLFFLFTIQLSLSVLRCSLMRVLLLHNDIFLTLKLRFNFISLRTKCEISLTKWLKISKFLKFLIVFIIGSFV